MCIKMCSRVIGRYPTLHRSYFREYLHMNEVLIILCVIIGPHIGSCRASGEYRRKLIICRLASVLILCHQVMSIEETEDEKANGKDKWKEE